MLEKVNITIICISIIIYSILIGTPLNNNIDIPNFIIIGYGMIYILIKKIKDKSQYKIFSSKIDFAILLLCVSSVIPIIAGKNITNQGSFEYLIRYITIFFIYILIKNQIREKPNTSDIIINTIIGSGIIIFILGMDNLTYNLLENILEKLNITIVYNQDHRFVANFGYANTVAVLMGILYFLSIFKYENIESKNKRNVYIMIAFLAMTGIILSYSRAVWIMFGVFLILYIIFHSKRKDIIIPIIITGIIGILYSIIFIQLRSKEMYIAIYGLFIAFLILVLIAQKLSNKINIAKIPNKYWILISFIMIVSIVIFYIYGLTQTEPLQLFESVYSEDEYEQVIRGINGNQLYEFNFNIEAKSKTTQENVYSISIIERNKYDDKIEKTVEEFNVYNGIKNIKVNTKEETTNIVIQFKRSNKVAGEGLTIKDLSINQENITLKYKYLPKSLVDKISSINFSEQSVWERAVFIEDGLKILQDNILFGIGGDGYKYILAEYQQYIYGTNEVHCYPLEIWIEFGLLGIISLIAIIIFIVIDIFKRIKDKNFTTLHYTIAIIIAFMFTHSLIDFDMSFIYMQILFFIFIAMLSLEEKKIKENKIAQQVSVIIIICLIIFDLQYMVKNISKKYSTEEEKIISELQEEPYIDRLDKIEKLLMNKEITEDEIRFLIAETEKNLGFGKYEMNKKLFRAELLKELEDLSRYHHMKDEIENIQVFLKNEFEEVQEIIYQKDKTRLSDDEIEFMIEEWNRILE